MLLGGGGGGAKSFLSKFSPLLLVLCKFNFGLVDAEGGGGGPPGLADGPFIDGDSFLIFPGPFEKSAVGLKGVDGPLGPPPPPPPNLAPLFGNLGIPPANRPPRPIGAPPTAGPSSCDH